MKKTIIILLCLIFSACMLSAVCLAADTVAVGTCGKGDGCGEATDAIVWELTDDGVLTLTGEGEVKSYVDLPQAPWYQYRDSIKTVIVGEGITALNGGDFMYCTTLTSVSLPSTLKTMSYSFPYCTALESIVIPEGVTVINEGCFIGCTALKSVTLPDSLESIGTSVFNNCTALESIVLPSGVNMGQNITAFIGCDSLAAITVSPDSPYYSNDDSGVLYNKDKTALLCVPGGLSGEYTVCDGTVSIAPRAFMSCEKVTAVTMPDTVETVGAYAFSGCSSLAGVKLGSGITSIENGAFQRCPELKSIYIPAGVTELGKWLFSGCEKLESITVDKDNASYASDDRGVLFDKAMTTLITAPQALSGDYTVHDTVKAIGERAFNDCAALKNLTIPASVETIGVSSFQYANTVVFSGCDVLEGIWVDEDNSKYASDTKGVLYNKAYTTIVHVPMAISGDYTMPATVTSVGPRAFYNRPGLDRIFVEEGCRRFQSDEHGALIGVNGKNVTLIRVPPKTAGEYRIPEDVTGLNNETFAGCGEITALYIPAGVTNTPNLADCVSLAAIWVDENNTVFSSDQQGVLYNKDKTFLRWIPSAFAGDYTIPANIERVSLNPVPGLASMTFTGSCPVIISGSSSDRTVLRYPANLTSWRNTIFNTEHNNWQPYTLAFTPGDVNHDGSFDNADLVTTSRYIAGLYRTYEYAYRQVIDFGDMNGDGQIDNADLVTMARAAVDNG